MPFKDSQEGQTHSYNDGCGCPEHNDMIDPTQETPEAPHVGYCDSRTDEERANEPKYTVTSTHVGALHTQDILDEFRSQTYHVLTRLYSYSEVRELLTLQQERHKEEMREVIKAERKNILSNILKWSETVTVTETTGKQGAKQSTKKLRANLAGCYHFLYQAILNHPAEDIINKKIQNLT